MSALVRTPNGRGGMPTLASVNPWWIFQELDRSIAPTWAFEVEHTEDAVIISADVPGMSDEDVTVTVAGRTLTIEGTTSRKRRPAGFTRQFTLAEGLELDQIEAEVTHGVLTVYIPRTEQARPRKVKLGGGVIDKVKSLLAKNAG